MTMLTRKQHDELLLQEISKASQDLDEKQMEQFLDAVNRMFGGPGIIFTKEGEDDA